jgi:ketosteroid isomerase-like protein
MRGIPGLLLGIVLVGCASQAREKEAEATAATERIMQEFSASLGAGDADRWLALWAEDGMQLPPDAPPVSDGSWKIYRDIFNSNVPPGSSR